MSRTVCMVRTGGRMTTRTVQRPACTACGRALLDGVAVVNVRFIPNALICSGCDLVGVACSCERVAA